MKGGRIHRVSMPEGHDSAAPVGLDLRLLRRIWGFVRPHRRLLYVALATLPVATAFNLLQPYLIKLAIDRAIAPANAAPNLELLAPITAALVGAMMFDRLAQFVQLLLLQLCGQRAMHGLRCAANRHLLSLRSAFFDRTPVGQLMTRVTNDVESITEAFSMGLVSVVGDVITLVGIVAVMLWMSPSLALITLAVVPVLLLVVELFRRLLRKTHRLIRRRLAQINAALQEHITGMSVVQIFGQQGRAMERFDQTNRAHRDAYLDAIRFDASLFSLVEMLGSVTIALILWYGGLRVLAGDDGAVTLGLLVAFIEYVQRFFIPVRDLSAKYTVMQQAMAASERVFGLLDNDQTEPLQDRDDDDQVDDQDQAEAGAPLVRFDDVAFAYTPGQPVLRELSFSVARGESVAVVGPTGAGKSTLVRLLTRLYELQGGRIMLGGRDVQRQQLAEVRRQVVVVNQDVFLFAGTVADNISLGDPALADEVRAAADRVGLTRLLALDRPVQERGANLSAGERQLVAFARALCRDPRLLVLDEATASVDPESERLVQDGIAELMRQRTSIVIAHRLTTIERADRILVLRRGRLVEQGSHVELLAADGVYAQMHRLQYVSAAPDREA